MLIRQAGMSDLERWVELRAELWPEGGVEMHREETSLALSSGNEDQLVLVAVDHSGGVCGFAEASLRRDYVNGCDTSPVAFLEGIYVSPVSRRSGVGRELAAAVLSWARKQGCTELASDALLQNDDSHAFHTRLGFEETERVVFFRKRVGPLWEKR